MTTTRDPSAPTTVDTRDRILVAAANVLARRGFAEAKLREIADLAAVRPPAVYYYFSSREELLAEVLHTGQQRVRLHVASALAALPADTDHEDRIAAACAAHLSIQTAMADFARAVSRNIAHAHGPAHDQLHRESEAYHDLWRGLLSAAAADGAIRTDLNLSTARMFVIGALNGSTEWFPATGDLDRLTDQAQQLVRQALTPTRPHPHPHPHPPGEPMSDATSALARPNPRDPAFLEHYTRSWSSGDAALLRTAFAEDGTYIDTGMGHTYTGVADVARFFRHMLRFSSDTHVDFTSIVVADGAFTAEWVWSGTADGPLSLGRQLHPATGRRYSVPGVAVCRSDAAGLVTYHRDYYDVRDLLTQVGVEV